MLALAYPIIHVFVTLQFLVHMLLCFYPTPTTDLEEPVQASPVGVLMDKKCEVKFFIFLVLPAHVSASVSHKCLLKFSGAIQVECRSTLWCFQPGAESTLFFWQLPLCRVLSLDSGEDEARCQARSRRRKPCQRRHETMYRGAITRSDGDVLEVAPGFSPFWHNIKMLFKLSARTV